MGSRLFSTDVGIKILIELREKNSWKGWRDLQTRTTTYAKREWYSNSQNRHRVPSESRAKLFTALWSRLMRSTQSQRSEEPRTDYVNTDDQRTTNAWRPVACSDIHSSSLESWCSLPTHDGQDDETDTRRKFRTSEKLLILVITLNITTLDEKVSRAHFVSISHHMSSLLSSHDSPHFHAPHYLFPILHNFHLPLIDDTMNILKYFHHMLDRMVAWREILPIYTVPSCFPYDITACNHSFRVKECLIYRRESNTHVPRQYVNKLYTIQSDLLCDFFFPYSVLLEDTTNQWQNLRDEEMEFRSRGNLYQDRELQTLPYCVTDFCFLHIQHMTTKVWLSKIYMMFCRDWHWIFQVSYCCAVFPA